MLVKPMVLDGSFARQVMRGDVVAGAEVIPVTIATNAITVTAANIITGIIQRTTTGGGTDTIDSAANLVAGFQGAYGPIENGTTFRCKWIQNAAFAITVQATANTGVTVTSGTVNASSVKEYLVTVVNGTPTQTFACVTANGSAILTGLSAAQTALLSPGMIVTNAVANLQGQTIISVQPGTGVTMSGNANATNAAPGVAVTFSPQVTLVGLGQGLL